MGSTYDPENVHDIHTVSDHSAEDHAGSKHSRDPSSQGHAISSKDWDHSSKGSDAAKPLMPATRPLSCAAKLAKFAAKVAISIEAEAALKTWAEVVPEEVKAASILLARSAPGEDFLSISQSGPRAPGWGCPGGD